MTRVELIKFSETKLKTTILNSSLCDYSNACIFVKGTKQEQPQH